MAVTSSSETITLHTPSSKIWKQHPATSVSTSTTVLTKESLKDKIIQSENHKRNVSRIHTEKSEILNSTTKTPHVNGNDPKIYSSNSKHHGVLSSTQKVSKDDGATSLTTEKYTRSSLLGSQLKGEEFYNRRKQIHALKLARENAHSVKKDMNNNYYDDKLLDEDESTTTKLSYEMINSHHITVKKSLNIEEEKFLLPKFYSTEQSIPNFNIGTDDENLTPSTQNIERISSEEVSVPITDSFTGETTFSWSVQSVDEVVTLSNKNENDKIKQFEPITSPSTMVNIPTPHVRSNVMKTNFLSRPSSHKKTDELVSQNLTVPNMNENEMKHDTNPNQMMPIKGKGKTMNGKLANNPSSQVEEKIEDTVFYTDIVDPEDQFDKKNEIYKNNYLDQNEYQAILDKFFNGKKQNRKMKVPKNILSIDKLLEQNTKKPMYLSNEAQNNEYTIKGNNETIAETHHQLNISINNKTNKNEKGHTAQTIILKDLDNMSAAHDTNPFIHWDDINENQQLESYRRKNKPWFILQLTGEFKHYYITCSAIFMYLCAKTLVLLMVGR